MKVAVIGRGRPLYNSIEALRTLGHSVDVIVTAKEAPEYEVTSESFRQLARDIGAAFLHTPRIGDAHELFGQVESLDVGISVNYPGIIPDDTIEYFRLGILNAHGGDLPRYRGNACQAWAILQGESHVGLCIHYMVGGELDSGDIIVREYYDLNSTTKIGEVQSWMECTIPRAFCQALDVLQRNPSYVLDVQSKDYNDSLRCYPRRPADAEIYWTFEAQHIVRLVNASGPPYGGAYFNFQGGKIVVLDASVPEDHGQLLAIPGQVLQIEDNFLDVATSSRPIRLKHLVQNGNPVSPRALVQSIRQRLTD
ncbi:MAG: formyltransferase family protein [Limnobacter sp.]|uniref:methionyl-tRNA formyltransferase n=1 Tax=Limnobacter sp. TaxID=2003368 RepID=UPI0032ED9E9B